MSRIRSIKPQFFLNDELASLHPLDRILFIGLWTMADREGRLEDRPLKIKAAILPYDDYDIEEALKRLAGGDFIVRYGVKASQKRFIGITNFSRHQCPNTKEPESTIPAPCRNNAGTIPASYRHDAGTLRLGKGKEGKGEKEAVKEISPSTPTPEAKAPEKTSNPRTILSSGDTKQPARAGPSQAMATGERSGKYDGIAENI